ncbi:MAG: response regulator transcription factor [Marmoricola sp.]
MIRAVLVDDQEIVRNGLARILGPEDGFEVVAECGDGDEVAAAVSEHLPDLVLMDLRMRRVGGIEATRELARLPQPPAVLVVTTFDEDDLLWGAIEAGAAGFVLKDTPARDLLAAARAVAGGGAWFDPQVTPRVLAGYRRRVAPAERERQRLAELTDREHGVLRLMARGHTNREIAAELHLGETTVKTHVGNIFLKLDARDRAAAIVYAFDHGVVGGD